MGDIIWGADFKRHAKPVPHDEKTMEQQAIEIMNVALMGEPGMCGMEPVIHIDMPSDVAYESSLGFIPDKPA